MRAWTVTGPASDNKLGFSRHSAGPFTSSHFAISSSRCLVLLLFIAMRAFARWSPSIAREMSLSLGGFIGRGHPPALRGMSHLQRNFGVGSP